METLLKHKSNILTLIIAVFIGGGLWSFFQDIEKTILYIFAGCSAILIIGFLFLNLKWYYLLLIALIPISVDAGFIGGAKLSFPSEGMLTLMLPVLFLFNKGYRQAVFQVMKHPITVLLIADLLIELLSALLSSHVDVSLKRIVIRFIFIAGFFVMVGLIQKKKEIEKPWLFYTFGLIPVMYFTLMNHAYHSFDPRVVFNICRPYFNDHTVYGACLAFIVPFLTIVVFSPKLFRLNKAKHGMLLLLYIFVLASEVLALSRAAILSLVVAFCFYLLLRYKVKFKVIVMALMVVLGSGVALQNSIYEYIKENDAVSNDGEIVNHFSSVTNVQSDASNLERINRWICAYRMFEERPILGYGPGTYQFEYNQFQTVANKTYISTNAGNRGNAHSEYLTYLSETGIIGFIIFVLTVFTSIYYGMENHYHLKDVYLRAINLGVLLGLVTFYFHGIFNSFIDQSKMAFLYFTALGTIVWLNQYRERQ